MSVTMRRSSPATPLRWRVPTALAIRLATIAGGILLLVALTRTGVLDPVTVPPPGRMLSAFVQEVPTSQFASDLLRTVSTTLISFGAGSALGIVIGVIGWRLRLVGDVLEPYLVTLYAMPTVVFYPILLALLGLGTAPIIVIAGATAMVPVAVNTTIALRSVNRNLVKLAASLRCSAWQRYVKIFVPAAIPTAMPGIRLALNYSIVYTVAMEFILASKGLGFRIGYDYRQFDYEQMWGLIIAVALLAILADVGVGAVERRLRRDRA